jgi:hypothetical protein
MYDIPSAYSVLIARIARIALSGELFVTVGTLLRYRELLGCNRRFRGHAVGAVVFRMMHALPPP